MKDITSEILEKVHPENVPRKKWYCDIRKIEEGRKFIYIYFTWKQNNIKTYRENKEKIKEHIKKPTENTVGEEIRNFIKYNLDFYHRI